MEDVSIDFCIEIINFIGEKIIFFKMFYIYDSWGVRCLFFVFINVFIKFFYKK